MFFYPLARIFHSSIQQRWLQQSWYFAISSYPSASTQILDVELAQFLNVMNLYQFGVFNVIDCAFVIYLQCERSRLDGLTTLALEDRNYVD